MNDPIVKALEQIETMLLQQQSEINQLRTDLNSLITILQSVIQSVAQQRPNESEGQP